MNVREFRQSLDYLFKAQLTGFVWGKAGIGKSTIVRDYAKEKGYKFFPFYLGTMSDTGDILGLAEFSTRDDGTKSTNFAPPGWMLDMIDYCEKNPESGAVIFLDEFNRARRDIIQGMFSLALDKTFHTIKLPKNCHIIAAGNPPTDEYFTTDIDDTALMARFVHIKLEPGFNEWVAYAKETDMDPTLVSFYQGQPELLSPKHSEFTLPVKPDARAVSHVDRLFKVGTPNELLHQLMYGIIGIPNTRAYIQHLTQIDKPLTAKEVLTGKKQDVIKKWSDPTNIESSYLNLSCDNVKEHILALDVKEGVLTPAEKKNLMAFLELIPKDIMFPLMDFLIKNPVRRAVKDGEEVKRYAIQDFHEDPVFKDRVYNLVKSALGDKVKNAA